MSIKSSLRCQSIFIYLPSENECIMELFKGQSLLEFTERFKTDLDCEEYLASLKVGRWILLSQMWS